MNITFATLREYAQQHNCGFDELRQRFGCGRGCALCVPYVRAMLKTGQTSFPADAPAPPNPDDAASAASEPRM